MKRWWNDWGKSTAWIIYLGIGLGAFILVARDENRERINHPLIVIIDKCEYIVVPGGMFSERTYTHKADCKNPIHAKSK